MKTKFKLVTLATTLVFFSQRAAYSQQYEINEKVLSINKSIKEISLENKTFQQKIELIGTNGKCKVTITEIDKKGKPSTSEHLFNFRDISKENLKHKVEKDLITITIPTQKKQKFIEKKKEGEFDGFDNNFEIFSRDYESSKQTISELQKIIEHFEQIVPENFPPSQFEEAKKWLKKNIKNINSDEKVINQSIEFEDSHELLMKIKIGEKTSKDYIQTDLLVNISDLNCESTQINPQKGLYTLEIPVKGKQKYISVNENGKPQNNVNEITLKANDLDELKLWNEALKIIEKIASEKQNTSKPDIENIEIAKKYFNTAYNAKMTDNCDCQLDQKDNNDIVQYAFNLFDFDEYSPIQKVNKDGYEIKIKTKGGLNYITELNEKNGQKFSNDLNLFSNNLEKVRYIDKAVKTIIKDCQEKYKLTLPEGTLDKRVYWLKSKIPNFKNENTSILQKLETKSGESCKWIYKVTTATSGKSKVNEYEIKPYLLDPYSGQIKVTGKNVHVQFMTIDKDKAIAVVEDGKPGNFTNLFSIQIDEIQRAKEVYEVMRGIINDCK